MLRVSTDKIQEMDDFEREMQPTSSLNSSKWAFNKFVQWQLESLDPVDLKCDEPTDIAESLRAFYFSLENKKSKELFPAVTLRGIRAGLHRYIVQPPNPRPGMNITSDAEFNVANTMLDNMSKAYAKKTYAKPSKRKASLSEDDSAQVGNYLSADVFFSPENLVLGAFFCFLYFLGKRGCEIWVDLLISDVKFGLTADNRKYLTLGEGRLRQSKNYQGGISAKDIDGGDTTRIYDRPESALNPYNVIQSYVKRVRDLDTCNESTRLFLLPNRSLEPGAPWYFPSKPAGKNTIAQYMPTLSKVAKLSQIYSNHSVGRTSVVSHLSSRNFKPHEIGSLTRHKNLNSLESYRSDEVAAESRTRAQESLAQNLERSLPVPSTSSSDDTVSAQIASLYYLDNNADIQITLPTTEEQAVIPDDVETRAAAATSIPQGVASVPNDVVLPEIAACNQCPASVAVGEVTVPSHAGYMPVFNNCHIQSVTIYQKP